MRKFLALLTLAVGFSIANAGPETRYSYEWTVETMICPSPQMQMLIRCPSRYEVTTATTSCKKFVPVDLCSGR